jgi:quercetin 2,3-dioxygenase
MDKPNSRQILRRSGGRGHFDFGWLDTRHTFSFGDYFDPDWVEFSDLRVINEDRIAPGKGFGLHGHRDMEILTWVLEGAVEHRDGLGNGEILRPGEIQRMTAGSGIRHSETNPSETDPLHLLQIWIQPGQKSSRPSYEQKVVDPALLSNRLGLVAGPPGSGAAVAIGQDARLLVGRLLPGASTAHTWEGGRSAWIHVARGVVELDGIRLESGDAVGIVDPGTLVLQAIEASEILAFDLR